MEEVWKDIPDSGGHYQVSNLGNVRSLDRDVIYSNGGIRHYIGRPIKPGENTYGYLQTHYATTDGKTKTILVHRLVAMLFVDGYAKGLEVNHKDENKHNNRADNLEWVTRTQNINYGSNPANRAESYKKQPYAKRCKILVVYDDGEKIGEFNGYKEAADALGFTIDYVSQLANGRKHKHYKVEIKRTRSYKIGQYKDGELVAVHTSLARAAKAIGVNWHLDYNHIGDGRVINGYVLKEIS